MALNIVDPGKQKALLLHCVREDVNDICDTLDVGDPTEEQNLLDKATEALTVHFVPAENKEF